MDSILSLKNYQLSSLALGLAGRPAALLGRRALGAGGLERLDGRFQRFKLLFQRGDLLLGGIQGLRGFGGRGNFLPRLLRRSRDGIGRLGRPAASLLLRRSSR